ncbi:hypothetical protein C8R45DRAFT_939530 [Mycena sanguinolenta]|nr:hypothetical protein C8R45DRAFT_939530 [Mycena sanguinolenta]
MSSRGDTGYEHEQRKPRTARQGEHTAGRKRGLWGREPAARQGAQSKSQVVKTARARQADGSENTPHAKQTGSKASAEARLASRAVSKHPAPPASEANEPPSSSEATRMQAVNVLRSRSYRQPESGSKPVRSSASGSASSAETSARASPAARQPPAWPRKRVRRLPKRRASAGQEGRASSGSEKIETRDRETEGVRRAPLRHDGLVPSIPRSLDYGLSPEAGEGLWRASVGTSLKQKRQGGKGREETTHAVVSYRKRLAVADVFRSVTNNHHQHDFRMPKKGRRTAIGSGSVPSTVPAPRIPALASLPSSLSTSPSFGAQPRTNLALLHLLPHPHHPPRRRRRVRLRSSSSMSGKASTRHLSPREVLEDELAEGLDLGVVKGTRMVDLPESPEPRKRTTKASHNEPPMTENGTELVGNERCAIQSVLEQ